MQKKSAREIFPVKLKYYMDLHGKDRNDIVRDLGFKYTTVRDWEIGNTVPRMDKVSLLANYFCCQNGDLIEETEKLPAANRELSEVKEELLKMVDRLTEQEAAVYLAALKSALKKE